MSLAVQWTGVANFSTQATPAADRRKFIADTLAELKVTKISPRRYTVFIRMLPEADRTPGGIWIPPGVGGLWAGKKRLMQGLCIAAGNMCESKPGDLIYFYRHDFAWWKKMEEDKQLVGWVDEFQVVMREAGKLG